MQNKKTLVAYESAHQQDREAVRILLIEDEESAAVLVQKYLGAVTFASPQLECADSLKGALSKLHRNAFDIVIADLNLPDSRGLNTLDAIVDGGHRLILVVSAEDGLRDAAIARGAYDFLAKQDLTKDALQRLVRLALVQAKANRSLRESEAKFRRLTALSSDMYWEQDPQYRFTQFSGTGPTWIATGRERMLGKRPWEIDYLKMTQVDWTAHKALFKERRPFRDMELGWVNEAGDAFWISLSGEPVFDETGQFKGYRGLASDITARKRAEQAVKESEERFRRTFELAGSGFAHIDLERRFIAVNRRLCEILGYSEQELLGLTGRQFSYPEDRDVINAQRPGLYAGKVNLVRVEKRYVRKDGAVIWLGVTVTLERDAQGKPLYEIAVYDDVTARKRAESALKESEGRFRSLTELSSDWYWEQDREFRLTFMSASLGDKTGLRAQAYLGRPRWEQPALNLSEADWARHRSQLERHEPFHNFEMQRPAEDGSSVWLSVSGEPVFDAEGGFSGYRGIGRDITAGKQQERLLRLEHHVALTLADAHHRNAGVDFVLRAICESEAWKCARFFTVDETAQLLRYEGGWSVPGEAFERFLARSREVTFRRGQGFMGTAWQSAKALWVDDASSDPRAATPFWRESGLRSAFVFPVMASSAILGVISISSDRILKPDERLLRAVQVIGSQLGQFLQRMRSEDTQRRFRAGLDAAADMVFLVDVRDAKLLDFNATACRYLGYERAELLGAHAETILAGPSRQDLVAAYRELIGKERREDSLVRTYRRKDGTKFDAEVMRRLIDTPEGLVLVVSARDLTERRRAEERQATHARYQEKIARLGQAVLARREPAQLVEDALQSALEGLGAEAVAYAEQGPAENELVLRSLVGLSGEAGSGAAKFDSHSAVAQVLASGVATLEENGGGLPFAWALDMRSTALVTVRGDRGVRGVLCAFSRTPGVFGTQELKFAEAVASILSTGLKRIESEGRLAFLAQFDPLTGLPNRALLSDRFSQMIVQAARHGSTLGVLFIDLDDFKLVNDTLGHAGGDELLKEVARRLEACVRAGDTVARISGDEFAMILADLARAEDAALVAQKVIERFAAPVEVHGKEIFVTASIGIAAYPADGDNAEMLLGAADAAMYRAKQSGRNMYQFFTADINKRSRARAQLSVELRRALERQEFRLVYQPKIDLKSGMPCGAEALLRWQHPERGLVSPMEFIPVLEETGLIVAVGEWVVRQACADLKSWIAAGLQALPISVNLSARQFRQQDLDTRIRGLVMEAGVDPTLIELEITESQLMHDPDQAIRVMRALRTAGIRMAIDDFGTGYSSLAYLTRFPVAALKIDRSFVADINSDPSDAAIVRTIIDMAHTLGFTVVAEGVETQSQASFLRDFGCEQAQGFLFAKPMPAAEFQALVQNSRPIPASK